MQPAALDDGKQVGKVGVLVVIDEEEIQCAGVESVFGLQKFQSASGIADGPDNCR